MRFEDIAEGVELPELVFPVTASAIAVGAIATNDYETVHHDKAAAEASGVPNIFMNILTTNGLVQRFVGTWAGPEARVRKIRIKLGAPNFAGDTMRINGTVSRVDKIVGEVDVAVSGRNGIGEHVGATVTLYFPERSAA
ncbi:MAG: acyl dehydratase [Alphaproteobacteria bacterium]|nr:acyl dehydratase [Alphaproteobacteria bacterium]